MGISERVCCSRFPAGSAARTSLEPACGVAHRATATGGATKVVIAIWILALAARLMFINQPYVDHWSWRQSDVAGIARNFYDGGFRFAYPQIDWAGNATGYVGTEFPILPFVAAICYKFAGIHEWIGRSQAVILFAVFLFARPGNFRQHSSGLGHIFLQFHATEYFCRPLVHAGRPIA